MNILCFFEKGCRWDLTFSCWGQQPLKADERQPFAEGKGMH